MRQVITVVVVFFAIQHSFSQSYTSVLVNLQNAIKERQVIAAKVVFSVADEDGDKRLTKFIYADNRATPWRAMYIPELQKTIYFDGINKTFSFFHSIKKMEVHEDIMAIYEMKKNLDVLSQVLMTRKESNVTEIDSTAIHYVIPRGEGKVDLVAIFKGDIGLNIKNKTLAYLIDTIQQWPVQMIDSTYFLERLVKRQEIVDTVYSDPAAMDSFYTLIKEWMNAYSLLESNVESYDDFPQFSYDTIYQSLTFVNYPPPAKKYILLDFYYVGCVACLQCLPNIKKLIHESQSEDLAVLAISGYDRLEKIERFNRIYNIDYSSANIPLNKLTAIVGPLAYPTYVLFDQEGNEILRATGCDPDFFEQAGEIISKK